MIELIFSLIFYSKIINYKGKCDIVGVIFPKRRGFVTWEVSIFSKVVD